MSAIHRHWLDLAASTGWPLDDRASRVDDEGGRLPPDLLVDLHLRWPEALGAYAFLAAASCGPAALSAVFLASVDPDGASGFAALGAVTAAASSPRGRPVAVTPLTAGVQGWACFGPAVLRPSYRGRFATPAQGLLAPKAARAYRAPPVPGLAVPGGPLITGPLVLQVKPPLTAVVRRVPLDDHTDRLCLVIGLAGDALERFAGPCGGRPDSRSCPDPQPVEFVNGVGPDCDGVLTLEFVGALTLDPLPDGLGAAVAGTTSLAARCADSAAPSAGPGGVLPSAQVAADPGGYVPPDESTSLSDAIADAEVPAVPDSCCLLFPDQADRMTEARGRWDFDFAGGTSPPRPDCTEPASLAGPSPEVWAYGTAGAEDRAVSVLGGTGQGPASYAVVADLQLVDGPAGALHNAGVVANYQAVGPGSPLQSYYVADVDYDGQALRLRAFDGAAFRVRAKVDAPGVTLGAWYTVRLEVSHRDDGLTDLAATLDSDTGERLADTGIATVNNYGPPGGLFGVTADHAVARFAWLGLEAS